MTTIKYGYLLCRQSFDYDDNYYRKEDGLSLDDENCMLFDSKEKAENRKNELNLSRYNLEEFEPIYEQEVDYNLEDLIPDFQGFPINLSAFDQATVTEVIDRLGEGYFVQKVRIA